MENWELTGCAALQTIRTVLPGARVVVLSSEHAFGANDADSSTGLQDDVEYPKTLFGASKAAQEVHLWFLRCVSQIVPPA